MSRYSTPTLMYSDLTCWSAWCSVDAMLALDGNAREPASGSGEEVPSRLLRNLGAGCSFSVTLISSGLLAGRGMIRGGEGLYFRGRFHQSSIPEFTRKVGEVLAREALFSAGVATASSDALGFLPFKEAPRFGLVLHNGGADVALGSVTWGVWSVSATARMMSCWWPCQ